jgi:pimeloyl-ACP methyl ester carboxylesterase
MSKKYKSDNLTIAGAQFHLSRLGAGRPVLFLHGLWGAMTPLAFYDELARERSILIPDHPGFGQSDSPAWLVGIGDAAYFYLDLIEQLDLQDLDIVGHSLGGWIAAEMAIRSTSSIRSLTLIAPAGIRIKGMMSGDFFLWSPEERARQLFHNQDIAIQFNEANSGSAAREMALKNNYAAARLSWQPRFYNPELQRWLHRIRIPVNLIWGDQDYLLPVGYAKAWTDALPQARLSRIPLCGHLPHVERAQETLSITRSCLREVAP